MEDGILIKYEIVNFSTEILEATELVKKEQVASKGNSFNCQSSIEYLSL